MDLFKIVLDEQQLTVMLEALELYSRVGSGQLVEVIHVLGKSERKPENYSTESIDVAYNLLDAAKTELTGMQKGRHLGIRSPELHDDFRVGYDMLQVIRNRLGWSRSLTADFHVWRYSPIRTSHTSPSLIHVVPTQPEERSRAASESHAVFLAYQTTLLQQGISNEFLDQEVARLSRELGGETTTQ